MDKQNKYGIPQNEIVLSNKKKQTIDLHNMDES